MVCQPEQENACNQHDHQRKDGRLNAKCATRSQLRTLEAGLQQSFYGFASLSGNADSENTIVRRIPHRMQTKSNSSAMQYKKIATGKFPVAISVCSSYC